MYYRHIFLSYFDFSLAVGTVENKNAIRKEKIMLPMIPQPRKADMTDARAHFAPVYQASVFENAAQTLCDFARRIHGLDFAEGVGGILFVRDGRLPAEGYTLTVDATGVTVRAADERGAQHAAVTLIQLMERDGEGFTLPRGTVTDAPTSTWRGIMIDLARDWHELSVLYEYVELCCFYKIKYLHLHFTDDQSYTLPSRLFPKLSTPGRSYSEEELRGLIRYAEARGVEIIPEIDVPGHCISFAAAYGDIFGTDGIICLSDESVSAMKRLFAELCELFAGSAYIHIGGDEAAIDKWVDCPRCLEAFRARGVDVEHTDRHALAEIMYATFIREMCTDVLDCGKIPVIWEGFAAEVNHLIPREAVVMSWENFYQTTPSLLAAGFRVVNCSWAPLYVVAPVVERPVREVYDWTVYRWQPVHPQSPYLQGGLTVDPTEQIEGGQLLAWGDQIERSYPTVTEGVRDEQRIVTERTPALAENTWNRIKQTTWEEFEVCAERVQGLYMRLRAGK